MREGVAAQVPCFPPHAALHLAHLLQEFGQQQSCGSVPQEECIFFACSAASECLGSEEREAAAVAKCRSRKGISERSQVSISCFNARLFTHLCAICLWL